jgi:hypothetical protein
MPARCTEHDIGGLCCDSNDLASSSLPICVARTLFDGVFESKAMIDSERFPSSQKFSTPHAIDEILDLLPPHVTLNVPRHILSLWFLPGPANGLMEGPALERAQSYAKSCGCKFQYHSGTREGVFYK